MLKVIKNKTLKKVLKISIGFLAGIIFILFVFWFFIIAVPASHDFSIRQHKKYITLLPEETTKLYQGYITKTEKELQKLNTSYNSLTPNKPYLVINTTKNHFFLYNSKQDLLREGFCSSGSYVQLISNDDRQWVFKTPKGMHTIKSKTRAPVWRKPDWAFIEEGLPVPSATHSSRYEAGVLGDYALSLGDGYLIHGTIYKRFLGMPVTHGCIRLADDDLEKVYNTLSIGSKVYIY